jgi:hypothetical protein
MNKILTISILLITLIIISGCNSNKIDPNCYKVVNKAHNYCKIFSKDFCNNQSFSFKPNYNINCIWQEKILMCGAVSVCQ